MRHKRRLVAWLLIAVMAVCQLPGSSISALASQIQEEQGDDIAEETSAECSEDMTSSAETEEDITEIAPTEDETVEVIENAGAQDIAYANKTVLNDDTPVTYELYVGGVQVTSANKDNITSAIVDSGQEATGSAVYDPDTNTLTLEDFEFTGEGYQDSGSNPFCAVIWCNINDLTLQIEGVNKIVEEGGDRPTSIGIWTWYDLIIKGSGTLTTKGSTPSPYGNGHGYSYGIGGRNCLISSEFTGTLNAIASDITNNNNSYASVGLAFSKTLTIENGTVNTYSGKSLGSMGLAAGIITTDLVMNGGALTAVGDDALHSTSYGIYLPYNTAYINGGTVKASGKNRASTGMVFGDEAVVKASLYSDGSEAGEYYPSYATSYKYIEASYIEVPYDLYMNGTAVTNYTARNLSVIDGVEGSASYVASTNTLNLNGVTITGTGESDVWAGIKYTGTRQLNINVTGCNTVIDKGTRRTASVGILTGEYYDYDYLSNEVDVNISINEGSSLNLTAGSVGGGQYPSSFGCNIPGGTLTITGDGTLSACGGSYIGNIPDGYSYGINAASVVTDINGQVHANGSEDYFSAGIATSKGLYIYNGKVMAEAGNASESYGVFAGNYQDSAPVGVRIEGGELIAKGGGATVSGNGIHFVSADYGDFIINGGKVTALTEATIDSACAIGKAPVIASGLTAKASKRVDGYKAVTYIPDNNSEYRWFCAPYEDWGDIPDSFKVKFNNDPNRVPEDLWLVFGNDAIGYTSVYTSEDEIVDYIKQYTGSAITFNDDVYVFHGNRRLWENRDYTLSYKNNINVATPDAGVKAPTLIVKGKGTYSSTAEFRFSIGKADIRTAGLTSEVTMTAAAGSKIGTVKPALTFAGKKLTLGKDYDLTYYYDWVSDYNRIEDPANTTVTSDGCYMIRITAHDGSNFEGYHLTYITVRGIDTKNNNVTAMNKVKVSVPKAKDLPYTEAGYSLSEMFDNRNGKKAKATVMNGKDVLEYNTDFYVYSQDYDTVIRDAGKHTVVIHAYGSKYIGEKLVTIEIGGTPASKVKIAGLASNVEYNGKSYSYNDLFAANKTTKDKGWDKTTLYTVNGKNTEILEENKDYKVEVSHNGSTGKINVTYTFMGGYTGVVKKTVNVKAANLAAATVEVSDAEYSKAGAIPEDIIIRLGNEILREGIDYTLSFANNTKPGTIDAKKAPTLTAKGIGNYTGKVTGKFNVNKSDIQDCVTLVAADKVYVEKAKAGYFRSVPKLLDGGKNVAVGKEVSNINTKTDYKYYYADTDTEIPADAILPAGTQIEVRVTVSCPDSSPYKTGENILLKGRYKMIKNGYDLKRAKVTVVNKNIQFNNGKAIILADDFTVVLNKKTLTTSDYEIVSIKNNRFLGTATVEIRGKGEYGGSKTFTFKINAKSF
ncbi:MAG: hypothetical protein K5662_04245 [Lachnospiraceae bacterium]|nr:hypothetical protein [Lachnospiraceae bacterium]